jgi:hypothetical protein
MDAPKSADLRETAKVDGLAAWIHALPYDTHHMLHECVDRAELVRLLRDNAGSPKRVKAELRLQAQMWREQERNCAFE